MKDRLHTTSVTEPSNTNLTSQTMTGDTDQRCHPERAEQLLEAAMAPEAEQQLATITCGCDGSGTLCREQDTEAVETVVREHLWPPPWQLKKECCAGRTYGSVRVRCS